LSRYPNYFKAIMQLKRGLMFSQNWMAGYPCTT